MAFVRAWEGGWSNDKLDPGGLTKWGVTIRTVIAKALDFNRDGKVNEKDLADMTEAQAESLYRSDYWDVTRCDELPGPLAMLVFDCNVNQGPGRGAKFLQAAVGAAEDGKVGPDTIRRATGRYAADPAAVIREFQAKRALHYSSLPTLVRFGLGWFRRLIDGTIQAAQWSAAPAAAPAAAHDGEFLADVAANAEAAARMARDLGDTARKLAEAAEAVALVGDDVAADLRDRALDLPVGEVTA